MFVRFLLAGVLAVASGALFRLHLTSGAPPLRMAATILLVATGLLLASALERWQIQQALAELERRLGTSQEVVCLALPRALARRYRWERGYLAIGSGGVMLLAAVGVSDAAWSRLAKPALRAYAASLRQAIRELKARVLPQRPARQDLLAVPLSGAHVSPGTFAKDGEGRSPELEAEGRADPGGKAASVPVFGMLVLLRRRVVPAERDLLRLQGVGLANPIHFPRALHIVARASVPGSPALPPAWQHAVRDAARQAWNARELAGPDGLPRAGEPAPASKG